jgi:hypothetical protein
MNLERMRQIAPRAMKGVLLGAVLLVSLGALFSGLLALFIVPAPNADTAVEVSGTLRQISPPHPEYGDLGIVMEGGPSYYVNRANEAPYFDWQRFQEEVRPGDKVTLTVVRPLAWRLWNSRGVPVRGPAAGVRTDSAIYMDPAIPAATWNAQATAAGNAVVLLLLLAFLLIIFGVLHSFQSAARIRR